MTKKLNLALCWHMHQPYYRKGLNGEYQLPWVYLHGIKDYDDMAAHLERHPRMKAVVNFAPVLLEQLTDYANQIRQFLDTGNGMDDSMLSMLAGATPIPDNAKGRRELIQACRRAHAPRMIEPYPQFQGLLQMFPLEDQAGGQEILVSYLDDQYFVDLLVWYHLAWCSHRLKQTPAVRRLMERAKRYTMEDRHELLVIIQETLESLIPRYRKLAESGQIEISMTPWGHPIVPLLNDFGNMKESQPDAPMPEHPGYPGGVERSRWHLLHGMDRFERFFGFRPKGIWLSEGGISDDAITLLDEMGIQWTASGEAVWHHSCLTSACNPDEMACRKALFIPYQLQEKQTLVYFRDDGLSDLIGFEYSKWHADDAVADFMGHLHRIATSLGDEADRHVVSVILDGENAWEYYPDNGHYFLDALYRAIENSDFINSVTFSEASELTRRDTLSHLVAGSWVYGSFSTWIGSPDKNRAWDLLVDVKEVFDRKIGAMDEASAEQARRMLAVCEGSDWFWWFGDYNPSDSVSDFDRLFRTQLKTLYCMLNETPPASLDTPVSSGGGYMENAGTMRRN